MVTQKAARSAFKIVIPQALLVLSLSGCFVGEQQQFFSHDGESGSGSGGNGGLPTPSATPSMSGTPPPVANTVKTSQTFNAATKQVLKIDFLFVVDNSGSMADNQAKLASGFEHFANTFYRRADLDICTKIITTDRYLGRANGSYQRERTIPCTKPQGSEQWPAAQMQAHIDNVIADFKSKVNVGTSGSGTELPGKSLVSFLYDLNSWNSAINPSVRAGFFRPDAVANISFVTDENNWFFRDPNKSDSSNDLPPQTGAAIYNDTQGRTDNRKGIKNHLDDFFSLIRPGQGLSYSVMALLELDHPSTDSQGIAMNLNPLVELVARESARGNISGDASAYTAMYQGASQGLIDRASAFHLTHNIYEPTFPNLQDLRVEWIQANGSHIPLAYGSDFDVVFPNGIILHPAIVGSTQPGDQVKVEYRYQE